MTTTPDPTRPGTYISRAVPIRAIQWTGDNYAEVASFHGTTFEISESPGCCMALVIPTPEGDMHADCGAWVAAGTEDELYPIKHSVFARKYDFAEEQPA